MWKKVLFSAIALLFAADLSAQTVTPNLGLTKPEALPGTWGAQINTNFDLLDQKFPGGVASQLRVQNEGVNLNYRPSINITGAGAECSDDSVNNRINCAITGGGGGSGHTIKSSGSALSQRTSINFLGDISCGDDAGQDETECTGSANRAAAYAWTGAHNWRDANFTILDDADPTKIARFQLSSINTATTRTYTLPNADGTVALTTSNVATATALAVNPTLCNAGESPRGILASGNATGCAAMNGLSGGTTNTLLKFSTATQATNSSITDDGTTVCIFPPCTKTALSTTDAAIPIYKDFDLASCFGGVAGHVQNTGVITPPTAACHTGTNRVTASLSFPDSDGDHGVFMSTDIPPGFTGTLSAKIWWWTAATSGNAVFQIATKCYAVDEADDAAFNTASTVTDTAGGNASRPNTASIATVDVTGCGADELMRVKFFRNRTHASDTLAATLNVEKVRLTMRVTP